MFKMTKEQQNWIKSHFTVMQLKTYSVQYEKWRETWSGRDQRDSTVTEVVDATDVESACKKVKQNFENNNKNLSHSVWIQIKSVTEIEKFT